MRTLYYIQGRKLGIKLSFWNGSLKGTETYYDTPHDSDYWISYYGVVPKKLMLPEGSLGIKSPNGYFLFHQSNVDATEMVGQGAEHMPTWIIRHKDIRDLPSGTVLRDPTRDDE